MVGLLFFNWDYTTAKNQTYLELPPLELLHFQIWKVQGSSRKVQAENPEMPSYKYTGLLPYPKWIHLLTPKQG